MGRIYGMGFVFLGWFFLPSHFHSSLLNTLTMAITSNASYIPTMDEFLGHWINVNNALPAPLVIAVKNQAMARDGFLSLRGALVGAEQNIQDKLNDIEIARADEMCEQPAFAVDIRPAVDIELHSRQRAGRIFLPHDLAQW